MWNVVLENLIPLLFTIATPVLLVLARGLFKKLAEKLHLEGLLVYQSKVDELVLKGIMAAEQKSLAAVKSGGTVTPGAQKLVEVLNFVNKELETLGLPKKAGDQLATLVEAKLFEMKVNN